MYHNPAGKIVALIFGVIITIYLIGVMVILMSSATPPQKVCNCGHICDGTFKCGLRTCPKGHK